MEGCKKKEARFSFLFWLDFASWQKMLKEKNA